jgi:hypothetical protein
VSHTVFLADLCGESDNNLTTLGSVDGAIGFEKVAAGTGTSLVGLAKWNTYLSHNSSRRLASVRAFR